MSHYRHILLTTNLKPENDPVIMRALALSQHMQAQLSVVYVLEHFPEDLPLDCIPPEDQDPQRFISAHIEAQLHNMAQRFGIEDSALHMIISTRSAKAEILEYAAANHIDLIVIGAHTHSGFSGLLGSTAAAVVLAATCDVLAVRL
jgi:universal stress protein A